MSHTEQRLFTSVKADFLKALKDRLRKDGSPLYSKYSVEAYARDAGDFCSWSEEEGVVNLSDITGDLVRRYGQSLADRFSPASQVRKKIGAKKFLKWGAADGLTEQELAGQVSSSPHVNVPLPPFLTIKEVEGFILAADRPRQIPNEKLAFRDPALIAVLSSGASTGEAAKMNIGDVVVGADQISINLQSPRTGMIRAVKLDPLPAEYMRLHLGGSCQDPSQPLFLSERYGRLPRKGVWLVVHRLSEELGLQPPITPTRLRYAAVLRGNGEVSDIVGRLGIRSENALRIAKSIAGLGSAAYQDPHVTSVIPVSTI